MDRKPDAVRKLDALRERVRSGALDRAAMREESQKIYAEIGVDGRIAGACRMREMRGEGAQRASRPNAAPPAARSDTAPPPARSQPQLQMGDVERGPSGRPIRPGLVFVAKGKTFEPRVVMLGSGNFDYTEVVSGVEEGEQVALLAALSLQAQRQQQTDRFRQNMGGGVPGMSQGGGGTRGAGARSAAPR